MPARRSDAELPLEEGDAAEGQQALGQASQARSETRPAAGGEDDGSGAHVVTSARLKRATIGAAFET